MVESGQKTQTIRKVRKHPTKPGQIAYLNTGMRTKNFRRLGIGMIESVTPFKLRSERHFKVGDQFYYPEHFGNGRKLAKKDGFKDWESFVEFFKTHYGLPFEGEIIKWRLLDG